MANALSKVLLHIVFSTKNRANLIYTPHDKHLYSYITKVCNELDCNVISINGYLDHIHILCYESKLITHSYLVKLIKGKSSRWIKLQYPYLSEFKWQRGYAVFSVDYKNHYKIKNYINNQYQHHRSQGYKEEFIKLLERANINYDKSKLWD